VNTQQALNRGYNLLCTAVLALAGLAFGTVGFTENEFADKVDDFGLLLVGMVAIVWFFVGTNRIKRTAIPLAMVYFALAVQVLGLFLEVDDQEAFGDNIGGMFLFVPALVTLTYQYWRTGRLLAATTGATVST
jgi:FtsH-binding integral membrane protein